MLSLFKNIQGVIGFFGVSSFIVGIIFTYIAWKENKKPKSQGIATELFSFEKQIENFKSGSIFFSLAFIFIFITLFL